MTLRDRNLTDNGGCLPDQNGNLYDLYDLN